MANIARKDPRPTLREMAQPKLWACTICGAQHAGWDGQEPVEVVPRDVYEGAVERAEKAEAEVERLRGRVAAATAEGYADGVHDGRQRGR